MSAPVLVFRNTRKKRPARVPPAPALAQPVARVAAIIQELYLLKGDAMMSTLESVLGGLLMGYRTNQRQP